VTIVDLEGRARSTLSVCLAATASSAATQRRRDASARVVTASCATTTPTHGLPWLTFTGTGTGYPHRNGASCAGVNYSSSR